MNLPNVVGFDTRLNEIMAKNDITQAELCKRTGLKSSMISFYCSGQRIPTLNVAIKIAQALNTSVEFLAYGNTEIQVEKSPAPTLTPSGQRIGRAYDKATPPVQRTVEVALEPYMGDKPSNVTPMPEPEDDEPELETVYGANMPAAAGFGNYLEGVEWEEYQFVKGSIPYGTDICIRIQGDSMEPTYSDGDWVFVKETVELENGEVGIFVLNGDSFCKRLRLTERPRKVWLESDNDNYDEIVIREGDELRTIGRVLGVAEPWEG